MATAGQAGARSTAAAVTAACWLAALLAVALTAGCRTGGSPRPAPNVVLISIDCLSQRQLAAALEGGGVPALADLARDSIEFTRAYANAPWTTPSHMTMLTGLYPSQHGRDIPWVFMAQADGRDRVPEFRTLAERLAARGYETAAFTGKGPISAQYGLGQGFDRYHEATGGVLAWAAAPRPDGDYSDLRNTDEAIRQWLDRRPAGRPFFLFVHTFDLHDPRPAGMGADKDAMRHIDAYVGRILFRLRELGLYDGALIMLTGDHGSRMPEGGEKCCVHGAGHYQDNLHVPLLLKLPGTGGGGRSDLLVRHVDLFATVLDVVGEPLAPYDGPGVSIVQRLNRSPGMPDPVTESFSEADGLCVLRSGLITTRYNYIYTPGDTAHTLLSASIRNPTCPPACRNVPREELYDLGSDPTESRNLLLSALDPDAAAALRHLRAEMQRHLNLPKHYRVGLAVAEAPGGEGGPRAAVTPDAAVEEAMRRLGYLPDK